MKINTSKILSNMKKKNNDLSQVVILYALDLDKKTQSKSSTLSNTMATSTTTNLFKHDGKKKVVHVLQPEATNDSIIPIVQAVDLVDSYIDLSKLPKQQVDDQSKLPKKRVEFCLESNNLEILTL